MTDDVTRTAAGAVPNAAGDDATRTRHPSSAEHTPAAASGTLVDGRYKLVEPLGEGGMGEVWLAHQSEPVKRSVAVKLVKAGMDSKAVLARFDAERQALALMDHPNIARVIDGGLHAGKPYFVMELVKGVSITDYCDRRKLTPRERLELFIPVCQAIQHAHQKGVIHRDIKPSNVLVALYDDKPVPKVIDFGVAKATGVALTDQTMHTGIGGVVGTPQYMSPEQATLGNPDIDTRSDVYSLGVLLYELLAGSPPFQRAELARAGLLEVLRVVREEEPPRPSTKLSTSDALPTLSANRGTEPRRLAGLLRSELDWVVMKALEKDRTRRYETANGFAADVARYLAGEPVAAHPPSAAYRLRKFVRRNKGRAAAAGLVMAVLVAGLAGTTWGLVQARAEAARAETAEADAVEQAAAAGRERDIALAAHAAEAVQRRAAEAANERARAVLKSFTGDNEVGLLSSKDGPTTVMLRNAAEQWKIFTATDDDTQKGRALRAEGLHWIANFQRWIKEQEPEAKINYRAAITLLNTLVADAPDVPAYRAELARTHLDFAKLLGLSSLLNDHDKPEALQQYRAALAIQEKLVVEKPEVVEYRADLARTYSHFDVILSDDNKVTAARYHRAAAALYEKLVIDVPGVARYQFGLACSYDTIADSVQESTADALNWYGKAINTYNELHAIYPDYPCLKESLSLCFEARAKVYDRLKRWDDAIPDWDKAVELSPPADQPKFRAGRANAYVKVGRVAEAVAETANLAKSNDWDANGLYGFACIYAVGSAKLSPGRRDEYATRAVELLRMAVAKGWEDAAQMANDKDLNSLRGRADYQALVAELAKKFPPAAELAPPPRAVGP